MGFKKFNKGSSANSLISIQKRGAMYINRACEEEFFKDYCCGFVTLWFDEERQIIGIKLLREQEAKSYTLIKMTNGGSLISSQHFMRFYGISCLDSTRYTPKWSETVVDMIELQLIIKETP